MVLKEGDGNVYKNYPLKMNKNKEIKTATTIFVHQKSLGTKGLFTPWTMKLSQDPIKIYDWLLNSSQDLFSSHQGKKMSQ